MPRLLKEKYPDCKVYVPSVTLLEKLFSQYAGNWNAWGNPFTNVENVFKDILVKTMDGNGCQQLKVIATEQETISKRV